MGRMAAFDGHEEEPMSSIFGTSRFPKLRVRPGHTPRACLLPAAREFGGADAVGLPLRPPQISTTPALVPAATVTA
jgi:hypothetical protein